MRIQTIHRNPMGDVLNECSAQGFRITNAEGNSITVTVEGDQINIEGDPFVTGYHNGRISALRMIPNGISGKKATGVIIDELMPRSAKNQLLHACYECGKPAKWLADDSRCSRCTRLTPDEIIGGS